MTWSSGFRTWTVAITVAGSVASWTESAHAFRPFDGTDATVADVGEFELELEPLGLLCQGSERTLVASQMVLNVGVAEDWEAVLEGQGETALAPASANATLVENGAFLKGVGILQADWALRRRAGQSDRATFSARYPMVYSACTPSQFAAKPPSHGVPTRPHGVSFICAPGPYSHNRIACLGSAGVCKRGST